MNTDQQNVSKIIFFFDFASLWFVYLSGTFKRRGQCLLNLFATETISLPDLPCKTVN